MSAAAIGAALVIAVVGCLSYFGLRNVMVASHQDTIKLHQDVIIRAVNLYNSKLEHTYKQIDTKKYVEIVHQLESNIDFSRAPDVNMDKLRLFARREGVNIELVDKQSTQVILDTQNEYTGVFLNKWERASNNIKFTQPGIIQYHYTYADIYFYLFTYYQPVHSDFVWVIYERKGKPDNEVHQIISYFKFDKLLKENFEFFGLFDSYLGPVHGISNFPKEMFRGNNFDIATIKKDGVVYSWIPITHSDENFSEKYIRYIGLGSHIDRFVAAKMIPIRFWLLVASLALWVLFMLGLIVFQRKYLHHFARMDDQIKKCIAGTQAHIVLEEEQPLHAQNLGKSFNEYVDILERRNGENKALASQVFSAWDNSKKQLNQDLHDSIGQLLVAAKFKLAKHPQTADARDLIQRASEELRTIYDNAEPPGLSTIGLEKALQWYVIKFFPDNFAYSLDINLPTTLNGYVLSQIYRVAQEIIANARKHNHEISYFSLAIGQEDNKFIIRAENDCDHQTGPLHLGNGLKNIKLRIEALAGHVTFTRLDRKFIVEAGIPLALL